MELNAEKVKKGLVYCSADTADCHDCPYGEFSEGKCFDNVKKDALALINSYEQRIKELTEDNEYLKTQITATEARYESRKESDLEEVLGLRLKVEELTEENERLTEELAKRPPKLVITKLPKQDQIAKEMLEGEK